MDLWKHGALEVAIPISLRDPSEANARKLAQFAILRQYPVNRHRTLASPHRRIGRSNPVGVPSTHSISPTRSAVFTLSFDGGARCSPKVSAYAGCVWLHPGKPLWWTATSVFPGGTNNEMEASALLAGLQWIREHHPQQAVLIVGDSAIVAAMAAATMRVRA
ncbi:Ribonuclease H-like domain [Phytophthora cactorum]|nr:Ribonuclease H-like domain [Phytophthora cactorum]